MVSDLASRTYFSKKTAASGERLFRSFLKISVSACKSEYKCIYACPLPDTLDTNRTFRQNEVSQGITCSSVLVLYCHVSCNIKDRWTV